MGKTKLVKMGVVFLSTMVCLSSCVTGPLSPAEKAARRESVRAMADQTLADLYKKNPGAKSAIGDAAGYAVFSDFGFQLLWFGGGVAGRGIAVNNSTKQETLMKMAEVPIGIGLGAEKYRTVFVFDTPAAFDKFVAFGWEAGADAIAAAETKNQGGALAGAVTVSQGVSIFQIDTQGAIVATRITSTKFYKDKKLS